MENGTVAEICYLAVTLPQVNKPETCILSVCMTDDGREVKNEWPLFIYPEPERRPVRIGLYDPSNLYVTIEKLYDDVTEIPDEEEIDGCSVVLTSRLTPAILRYAQKGGKVIYIQHGKGSLASVPVAFWREGMVCYDEHPALGGIRYESWMDDLRFFGVAADTAFSVVEDPRFTWRRPIIRRYDCREWRADDYMVELGCGEGRIIATTLRLEGGMGKQPMFLANNRFGRWLLHSAVNYLMG